MMRPVVSATALAVIGVTGGTLLMPGPVEHVTMLARDGKYQEAISEAERLLDLGYNRAFLLKQAFNLNYQYGDENRAAQQLTEYLKLRPTDVSMWRMAADFYQNTDNLDALQGSLERIVELSGDRDVAERLFQLCELTGRYQDELQFLHRFQSVELKPERRVRFAALLFGVGDLKEAAIQLELADRTLPKGEVAPRLALFDVLLEQKNFEEAATLAGGWLSTWNNPVLEGRLVRNLLWAGADQAALRIVFRHEANSKQELSSLGDLLARDAPADLLRRVFERWIQLASVLPPEKAASFFDAVFDIAIRRNMEGDLFKCLLSIFTKNTSPLVRASVAKALFDRLGYNGITAIRTRLTYDVLIANPLLGAQISLLERNATAAQYFLHAADLTQLSERDSRVWFTVAEQILSPPQVLDDLLDRARAHSLPSTLTGDTVALARQLGRQPQLKDLWDSLSNNGSISKIGS
jgi:tetratricopeptide (TPR) repeat protein